MKRAQNTTSASTPSFSSSTMPTITPTIPQQPTHQSTQGGGTLSSSRNPRTPSTHATSRSQHKNRASTTTKQLTPLIIQPPPPSHSFSSPSPTSLIPNSPLLLDSPTRATALDPRLSQINNDLTSVRVRRRGTLTTSQTPVAGQQATQRSRDRAATTSEHVDGGRRRLGYRIPAPTTTTTEKEMEIGFREEDDTPTPTEKDPHSSSSSPWGSKRSSHDSGYDPCPLSTLPIPLLSPPRPTSSTPSRRPSPAPLVPDIDFTRRPSQDPNNLLPLSVNTSPYPSPPRSRFVTPLESPASVVHESFYSDEGGEEYFTAPKGGGKDGGGGKGGRSGFRNGSIGSSESGDEEYGAPFRSSMGVIWEWGTSSHRTDSFATAGSSNRSSLSHPPMEDQGAGIGSALLTGTAIASELSKGKRRWRRWVGFVRRKMGWGWSPVAGSGGFWSRLISESEEGEAGGVIARKGGRRRLGAGAGKVRLRGGDGVWAYRVNERKAFPASGFGLDLGKEAEQEWVRGVAAVVPVAPWSIICTLCLLAGIASGITFTLIHILNPDKTPLPWRDYCQTSHPTFYSLQPPPTRIHASTLVIPVASDDTFDSTSFEHTTLPAISPDYLQPLNASSPAWPWPSHTTAPFEAETVSMEQVRPVGVYVGVFTTDVARERRMMIRGTYGSHGRSRVRGTEGVRVRFVMGRPKPKYERLVRLEMETYGDILLLDIPENMNSGKSHAFFAWAAENATVPDFEYTAPPASTPLSKSVAFNSQHRGDVGHNPAQRFLAGLDVDATGWDLSEEEVGRGGVVGSGTGRVAKEGVVGERKPDYVVKADDDSFIMLGELERRLRVSPRSMAFWGYLVKDIFMAGECYALSFDLVQYIATTPALKTLTRGKEDKLVARWMRMHPQRDNIVWVSERCWIYDHPKAGTVYSHGFIYPSTVDQIRAENSTQLNPNELRLRGGQSSARAYSSVTRFKLAYRTPQLGMTVDQEVEALVEGSEMSLLSRWSQHPPTKDGAGTSGDQQHAALTPAEMEDVYRNRPTRAERFRNDPMERGGTVVVHYIKRHEWFMETALALLGPSAALLLSGGQA